MLRIHREGYPILAGLTAIFAIIFGGIFYIYPQYEMMQNIVIVICVSIFTSVIYFFRDPVRAISYLPDGVIAPADGKVVAIEETTENEYLKQPCRQISIFMSPLNVHVNRAPVRGIVQYVKHHEGVFLPAWNPKSSEKNERNTVVIQTEEGKLVLYRQIAGAMARRICCYVEPTQVVQQGQEVGFIKFGSRVDIFIPLEAKVNVQLGQHVKGGQTILADFAVA
jgi:phosphatidylserine decarboxylase